MTTDFDECGSAAILYGQILLFLGLVREVLYTEGVDDVAEAMSDEKIREMAPKLGF